MLELRVESSVSPVSNSADFFQMSHFLENQQIQK